MTRKPVAATLGLMLGLIAANTAHAAAHTANCLNADVVEAARIQEFHAGMLVTQLRCRMIGVDFGPSLIRFETTQGQALIAAEDRLTRHFNAQPDHTGHDVDDFTTRLGNRYGTGALTLSLCGVFHDVAEELGKSETPGSMLSYYAKAMVPEPPRVPGTCPTLLTRKQD